MGQIVDIENWNGIYPKVIQKTLFAFISAYRSMLAVDIISQRGLSSLEIYNETNIFNFGLNHLQVKRALSKLFVAGNNFTNKDSVILNKVDKYRVRKPLYLPGPACKFVCSMRPEIVNTTKRAECFNEIQRVITSCDTLVSGLASLLYKRLKDEIAVDSRFTVKYVKSISMVSTISKKQLPDPKPILELSDSETDPRQMEFEDHIQDIVHNQKAADLLEEVQIARELLRECWDTYLKFIKEK